MAKQQKNREDWVKVRLTAHGAKLAGDGVLRVIDRATFEFTAGEVKEVTRAVDWQLVLSKQFIDGEPLFELVTETV